MNLTVLHVAVRTCIRQTGNKAEPAMDADIMNQLTSEERAAVYALRRRIESGDNDIMRLLPKESREW